MAEQLHYHTLFRSSMVTITDVRCRPVSCACGTEEESSDDSIAFPRAGAFVKHVGRQRVVADSNQVVFFNRGESYRVSHPVPGGDDCTSFAFAHEVLVAALSRHRPCLRDHPDSRLFDVTHGPNEPRLAFVQHCLRQQLRVTNDCPALVIEELALELLDAILDRAYDVRGRHPEPETTTARVHRERAEATKAFLAARFRTRLALVEVARGVHTSPYHLARVFRREVGIPIHQYVNRLRLGAALEHLANGADDLTELALDLGYSSHSHFSDSFRRAFGTPPSDFRRALTAAHLGQLSKNLKV
jgi:AraC family transcriptional regulator